MFDLVISFHLWDSDAFDFGVVVLISEAISIEGVILHSNVVESADSVEIRSFAKFNELLSSLVEIHHSFDAVEMLSNVVLVLEYTKGSMDLVFVHVCFLKLFIFN